MSEVKLREDQKESVSTRDNIQRCALKLFQQYGYENVTVVQICKEAGITKRTFYYHYDSKADLLHGLIDLIGVQAENLLDSLAEQQSNIGILWTLMSVYAIHSANYGPEIIREIYALTARGEVKEDFPFATYLYSTALRTLKNASLAGEIPNPSPPEELAFSLYHAFRSVAMTWASTGGAFDEVETFRRVFSAILGVAPDSF